MELRAKGKAEKIAKNIAKNIAKKKQKQKIEITEEMKTILSLEDDVFYRISDSPGFKEIYFPGKIIKKWYGIDIH